jgi:hypothetical protein
MTRKPDALEAAVKGKQLQTRPRAEIQADLDEAIRWAETEGRALPIRVKRGRPKANESAVATRSVTVRFPVTVARQVEAAAKRSGESLSEFVRAAAYAASRAVSRSPAKPSRSAVRDK